MAALSARERSRLTADIEAANRPAVGLSLEELLRRLVRAAIRRQLARPGLARVLDFEEQRLVLDESDRAATGSIVAEVAALLRAHRRDLQIAECEEAALDLVAIARALIDSAASRDRIEPATLENRVMRAAMGYLTAHANVAP